MRRFKNKKLTLMKKIIGRLLSLFIPFVVFFGFVIFILEVCFYFKHGDFFFRKSIHFQLEKFNQKDFLEKLPKMDETHEERFFQAKTNNDLTEEIAMPAYVTPGKFTIMFSCWVKTDEPEKVRLILLKDGESIKSAYHSGNGHWEFLSVNALADAKEYGTMITSRGASFKYCKSPILFSETRDLSKTQPQTRGEVFYKKNGKVRIVFVGGSTTFGTGTFHSEGADYPYILQQMFDVVYPGKVNVLNYGMSSATVKYFLPHRERIKSLDADIICIVVPWNDSLAYLQDCYFYKDKLINYSKWIDRLEQGIGNRVALGYYLKNILIGLHSKVEREMLGDYENQVNLKGQSSTFFDAFGDEISKNPPYNYGFFSQLKLLTDSLKSGTNAVYYGLLPFYANRKEKITDEDIILLKEIRCDALTLIPQIQMTIPVHKMDRNVIEKAAKTNHISFFDLVYYYPFDQIAPKKRFDCFADPVHFTRMGNDFVAKGFFEALISDVSARLKSDRCAYFLEDASQPPSDMVMTTIHGRPVASERMEPLILPWIPVANFQIIDDLIRATGSGVIKTAPFLIQGSFLRFKLMGDSGINNPDILGIKFYVDGKLISSITPVCSKNYCETYVDMHDHIGKELVVEIVDKENDPKLAFYDVSFE